MPGNNFHFKKFSISQEKSVFKIGTDGVLLGAAADISGSESILDIGTGTGLIALMLAQRSGAFLTAIEPDKDSFEEASENIRRSPWSHRIQIENITLQEFNPQKEFDLIVTNPPYFTGSLRNPDEKKASARHNVSLSGRNTANCSRSHGRGWKISDHTALCRR